MEGFASFDWDSGNRSKCRKHGVSIAEIESVFTTSPFFATDATHSGDELRAFVPSACRPVDDTYLSSSQFGSDLAGAW